jgi:hypothetical protein
MSLHKHVNMAVTAMALFTACLVIALSSRAGAIGPLAAPLAVRFELADGVRVTGEMTACDNDGFEGSFGRREWIDLEVNDAWRLHLRVMDQQAADDWVNLGRVMLLMRSKQAKAQGLAERAFRRAVQIDDTAPARIDQVKDQVSQVERAAREARREAEARKLTTHSPEAGPWSADLWPALNEQEQAAAVATMKADAQRVLQQARAGLVPVETDHFIIYSDIERTQMADWALRLERVRGAIEVILNPGVDPKEKDKANAIVPWGKIVVFIWSEQDRYRMVEADAFEHLVPRASVGVCHPVGPKAFVNMHRCDDDELFEFTLIVESVHALLHHYRSPARLPAWANEGLAEYIASRANRHSHVRADRRKAALDHVRSSGLNNVLSLTYAEGWPANAADPGVGGLIVELMINQRPRQFARWLHAIKAGKEWTTALREDYGVAVEEFASVQTQYWRVNN